MFAGSSLTWLRQVAPPGEVVEITKNSPRCSVIKKQKKLLIPRMNKTQLVLGTRFLLILILVIAILFLASTV